MNDHVTEFYSNVLKLDILYNMELYKYCLNRKKPDVKKSEFQRKWKKYLSEFFCNSSNFKTYNSSYIYLHIFLENIIRYTDIRGSQIIEEYMTSIMNNTEIQKKKEIFCTVDMSLKFVTFKFKGMINHQIIHVNIFNKLIKNDIKLDDIIYLILKYYFLGIDTGFFWSIDRDIYDRLIDINDNKYCIECFASPLNHTIDNYCSLYEEDKIFGSLGNFFTYADCIIKNNLEKRLVINPPYTELMIEKTIEKIIEIKEYVNKTEFFILLPYWEDMECIKNLINRNDSEYIIVEDGQYILYNHIKNEDINTPMALIYIIIKGEDDNFCLDNIRYN